MEEVNGISDVLGGGCSGTCLGTRNLVQDALDDDDADVDAAGDVGKELGDEVADGVEGVTGEDASGGRSSVALDAGNVEVR